MNANSLANLVPHIRPLVPQGPLYHGLTAVASGPHSPHLDPNLDLGVDPADRAALPRESPAAARREPPHLRACASSELYRFRCGGFRAATQFFM